MNTYPEIILAVLLSFSMVISNTALFNVLKLSMGTFGNEEKKVSSGVPKTVSLILCLTFKLNSLVVLFLLYKFRNQLNLTDFLTYFCAFLTIFVVLLGVIVKKNWALK